MYIFFNTFLAILLVFFVIGCFRRKAVIRKICSMTCHEKCCTLNSITKPFGFLCLPRQDIFTSTVDAWQRNLGYHSLYNKSAAHFNMVFDYQPVYFDYDGRTWLIELWKGQYGINTGCEIGVYHADRILSETEWDTTLFHAADDKDMLEISISLMRNCTPFLHVSGKHWWLTGFSMGTFSWPFQLEMEAAVTFPNCKMLAAFLSGLKKTDLCKYNFEICGLTLAFHMHPFRKKPHLFHTLAVYFSQWKNRLLCRIFLFASRPFTCSADRLLYLYYFLPFAFRRTMHVRGYRRKYMRRCTRGRA